ncbi:MAG: nickel pincer cofactor biosynthesis protein LarC [Acidimicrobiales bacterium]
MSRVAYVQCSAGVAGDMLLGALVDAGADRQAVFAALDGLGVEGYTLTFERTQRCGVAANWANVAVGRHDEGEHRPARQIRKLLDAADLPTGVRTRAHAVFDTLAVAEGAVHGIDADDVEFHEVGAVDALVDVVGIAAALESLGIERIVAGPVAAGHGVIDTEHGALPNPPPAVARLLASRQIPVIGVDTGMELATPTGVAVLAALAESFGAMPPMSVTSVGCGAGTADPSGRPNVVQVIVGEAAVEEPRLPRPGRAAIQVDVNVDDVTGEVIAHTIATLLAAGVHDAWATPIVMKKGRPAHTVSALCDPADAERVAAVLLAETGSLGVRASSMQRWPQARRETFVEIDGHRIAVKLGPGRVKVEHDDAAAAARALGRPLRDVLAEAERLGGGVVGS